MRHLQAGERLIAGNARAVALVVLDSVGIGAAADAAFFGDEDSATLPHLAEAIGGVSLPNLGSLGLGRAASVRGVSPEGAPTGSFGVMEPRSAGKDTTSGHWEIAGIILDSPFPTYPEGFPPEVIAEFERRIGTEVLGNIPASGTEIIARLGDEHVSSRKPIVYTSADSVFQIATHTDIVPLETLYEMCGAARELLRGRHEVGRVIARPFSGSSGSYARIPGRHDFSVEPPGETLLDAVAGAGLQSVGVGKISDIFAGRGITSSHPTRSNDEGVDEIIRSLGSIDRGLVFANLVDFDEKFGHRNDPAGYGRALEAFDARLPEIQAALGPEDVLVVTADHGNDPTTPTTDHSRERVPVLVQGAALERGRDLGTRSTFADCGATICALLGIPYGGAGSSFAPLLEP